MIIDGKILYADPGKTLRRISDGFICGNIYVLGYAYYIGGKLLSHPILEKPEHFEEIALDELSADGREEYPGLVEQYIREKFSVSQELAIQRQRDTKPEEFDEYFRYCEDCKIRAKQELGLLEPVNDEQQSI